ncbi:MAG: ImmA/IrrE family metallo-endopeptidase [Actinocatenispora sp.]
MTGVEIGQRAKARLAAVLPDRTHREIAGDIAMTPDAFSRALAGKRAFSSIELARLADLIGTDIHWLITGEPDPHRLVIAARHDYDFDSRSRDVPGRQNDEALLRDVGLAYRQAYQGGAVAPSDLPGSAAEVRRTMGPGFVRQFADRLETRMGVDVVRLPALSTSYCFSVAGRRVIVVAATGNWFRENWSIAHELGHFVERHLDSHLSPVELDAHEAAANAFAAELLLPAAQMRERNWEALDAEGLARLVWESGVSADALARRLSSLGIEPTDLIARWAQQPTQRLLRRHWRDAQAEHGDAITQRMDDAATRRFPLSLQRSHLTMIARGDLGKGTLAWMLGIVPDDLEVDAATAPEDVDPDVLASALGL